MSVVDGKVVTGRRSSGYFDLRKLDGTAVHNSAKWKDLQLIKTRKSFLFERKEAALLS